MHAKLDAAPEFHPSAAQRRFVEFVVAHPEFKTVTQFCEAADVPRSTYETWCRKFEFRTWFIREWSSALLFEGWHVMNLARANMVNSPVHFQALFQLLFSRAGQVSLSGWAERGALAPEDTWNQPRLEPAAVEPELLPEATETALAARPAATQRLRTSPQQNQQLAAGLRKKPPTPSTEALARADLTPTNIYRQLRNVILRIRKASL